MKADGPLRRAARRAHDGGAVDQRPTARPTRPRPGRPPTAAARWRVAARAAAAGRGVSPPRPRPRRRGGRREARSSSSALAVWQRAAHRGLARAAASAARSSPVTMPASASSAEGVAQARTFPARCRPECRRRRTGLRTSDSRRRLPRCARSSTAVSGSSGRRLPSRRARKRRSGRASLPPATQA